MSLGRLRTRDRGGSDSLDEDAEDPSGGGMQRPQVESPREGSGAFSATTEELAAIARVASRRWPWLAPGGGRRRTPEDIDEAVSILAVEIHAPGFLLAWRNGMTRAQAHGYLLKALHDRLYTLRERSRRVDLLDDHALECMSSSVHPPSPWSDGEAEEFAGRVLAKLTAGEKRILADQVGASRSGADEGQEVGGGSPVPSRRTRARSWRRVKDVCRSIARDAELNPAEMAGLIRALTARLAGWERRILVIPGMRGISRTPCELILLEAKESTATMEFRFATEIRVLGNPAGTGEAA